MREDFDDVAWRKYRFTRQHEVADGPQSIEVRPRAAAIRGQDRLVAERIVPEIGA